MYEPGRIGFTLGIPVFAESRLCYQPIKRRRLVGGYFGMNNTFLLEQENLLNGHQEMCEHHLELSLLRLIQLNLPGQSAKLDIAQLPVLRQQQ